MSKDRPAAESPATDAASPTAADVSPSETPKDVIMVGGPSEDGQGLSILRVRDNRVEAGELRNAAPGKPIVGELVKLSPRPESERLFDVEVLAATPHRPSSAATAAPPAAAPRKGPAKVASDAYRAGWDGIFGKPASKPGAGNSDLN